MEGITYQLYWRAPSGRLRAACYRFRLLATLHALALRLIGRGVDLIECEPV